MKLIEWAAQYLDIANDGFKAELLWWKWATGAQVAIPTMLLETCEARYVASFLAPNDYTKPDCLDHSDQRFPYTRYHLWACAALHTGERIPLILDGNEDNNEAVHKILWASGFGQWTVDAQPPQVVLDGLESDNDNTHAMSVMAMRLLGRNMTVRAGITDVPLEPLTYHAALVADVSSHLPRNKP